MSAKHISDYETYKKQMKWM